MTEEKRKIEYCSLPIVREREFSGSINPNRERLINIIGKKWVNGTVLHYYFFDKETDGRNVTLSDGSNEWRTWTTNEEEKNIVRKAFDIWKNLGIGLEFKEVFTREEAEVRIGFMRGDGHKSLVGRDIIDFNPGKDERTMNFGQDLTQYPSGLDTAIHETGHTIGFSHEHQNPKSGIVWNEDVVYATLAGHPNYWSPEVTYHNIIKKLNPDLVQGSSWDPDSIMHYPFEPGLINKPEEYQNGLTPAGGLSERDKEWVRKFYPPIDANDLIELILFESTKLFLNPAEQKNFIIKPNQTRKYNIATFGASDSVMVLFKKNGNEEIYIAGDDDSGEDYNASMNVKLYKGREYILRVRLYYRESMGETAVMHW